MFLQVWQAHPKCRAAIDCTQLIACAYVHTHPLHTSSSLARTSITIDGAPKSARLGVSFRESVLVLPCPRANLKPACGATRTLLNSCQKLIIFSAGPISLCRPPKTEGKVASSRSHSPFLDLAALSSAQLPFYLN